jgi:hypothetical protein
MPTSNDSSTTFRYFLAGLKPLSKATFWIPIGILALVGLGLWQYNNQTKQISPFPLGDKKLLPDSQWVGKEIPANTKTLNDQIPANPRNFGADPKIAPLNTSTNNFLGSNFPGQNSPSQKSSDNILNSLVSGLKPFDQSASQSDKNTDKNTVQDIIRQNSRTSTLFAPLLPNRANQNSAQSSELLPEAASRATNSRVIVPRGFNPPTQTESPLERAVNREAASSPPNFSQPSAFQNSTIPQGQSQIAPQPSLYSNSYQPPAYQPPGTGANPGGGNSYGGSLNSGAANAPAQPQPPAPGGGGFQSGF